MDKTLIVFLIIGAGFFYFVMNLVNETNSEDDKYLNTMSQQEQYAKYQKVDSIGQEILDVTLADPVTQLKVWNASQIKQEFLELFPDFDTMRGFVKNRVRGENLVQKLTQKINETEDKFFSGSIDTEQAKRMLDKL